MNDIEKKLEALKAKFSGKLEELKKEAETQKKQEELKPWKPEHREIYFTIENGVDVVRYIYIGDDIDESCILSGNYFPTRERVEQVAKKMRLLLRLEQLHDMLCPDYVPDYEDEDEVKYHVYFNHLQGKYNISCSTSRENPCMVAFDTKGNIEKAAGILNKEMRESK